MFDGDIDNISDEEQSNDAEEGDNSSVYKTNDSINDGSIETSKCTISILS